MKEYAVYINSETRDFEFDDDGLIKTVEDAQAYAQGVEILLRTHKREFFLLPNHGTDYDRFLGISTKYVSENTVKAVIREGIFQDNHIRQIDELNVRFDTDDRVADVDFKIISDMGDVIESGVVL